MDDTAALGVGIVLILIYVVIMLGMLAFTALIFWKIFAKTGYGGPMGLLMLIPVVNVIMFCVLAFGTWPIERELQQLRGGGTGGMSG